MEKNIYFVRHGESDSNIGGTYQGSLTPLSEEGKKQIKVVGERFTKINIDIIVTSKFERAIETGKAISKATNTKTAEPSDLFGEREHPPEAYGLRTDSEEYKTIRKLAWEIFEKRKPKYSTEEDFDDLLKRADNALEYLINTEFNNVVVVSHTNFTKFIVMRAILGDLLTSENFVRFLKHSKFENTGITHITYDAGDWYLNQWNDHAHLG